MLAVLSSSESSLSESAPLLLAQYLPAIAFLLGFAAIPLRSPVSAPPLLRKAPWLASLCCACCLAVRPVAAAAAACGAGFCPPPASAVALGLDAVETGTYEYSPATAVSSFLIDSVAGTTTEQSRRSCIGLLAGQGPTPHEQKLKNHRAA